MIELNLLPEVKLDYIKAERARRLVVSVSVLVAGASIAILVLLLLVDVAQKKHLHDLTSDITSESHTLEQKPSISKILTVQNQLESLTNLHSQKPAAALLFNKYFDEITPGNVSMNNFQIDFNQHTVTIGGTADTLKTVNQFVDTIKFTNYTTSDNPTATKAFSSVVLSSFSLNNAATGGSASQAASYTINFSYDPAIFDITKNVTLSVPSITTTRSELENPGDLFKAPPSTVGGQH